MKDLEFTPDEEEQLYKARRILQMAIRRRDLARYMIRLVRNRAYMRRRRAEQQKADA